MCQSKQFVFCTEIIHLNAHKCPNIGFHRQYISHPLQPGQVMAVAVWWILCTHLYHHVDAGGIEDVFLLYSYPQPSSPVVNLECSREGGEDTQRRISSGETIYLHFVWKSKVKGWDNRFVIENFSQFYFWNQQHSTKKDSLISIKFYF